MGKTLYDRAEVLAQMEHVIDSTRGKRVLRVPKGGYMIRRNRFRRQALLASFVFFAPSVTQNVTDVLSVSSSMKHLIGLLLVTSQCEAKKALEK